MSNLVKRWLNNSAANLVGGLSAALFNLSIPALVSRHLPIEQFSAWGLALQIVVYVNLLGLGLQMATAREIVQAEERQDQQAMLRIIRAAHSIGKIATTCGLLAVLLLAFAYPLLFPGIPAELLPKFRWALLLIGASTATQLLALVPMGVFQGIHQNIYFVAAQVVVRIVTVVLVWVGTKLDLQLLGLAAIVALCTVTLFPLTWMQLGQKLPWTKEFQRLPVDTGLRKNMLNYCMTLSVWNLSMLLVNSVGIIMVGRVAFNMSGAYSIAMAAATVLAGLLGALFSPLLTGTAAIHAIPERRQLLPGLLLKSTWACAAGLHILFMIIILLHTEIIRVWVGVQFVDTVSMPLLILVGAHALRNSVSPYAMMLLATGLHKRALKTAVLEAITNLLATIFLGINFGVIGVTLGTLVGVFVGVFGTLIFNTPNTPELTPKRSIFILKGFVLPSILSLPIYLIIISFCRS